MLKFIAKHSTIIMPFCSLIGITFPNLSNGVLVFLPQVLFFLMFFTLLGIDQKHLIQKMTTAYVWRFALFQSAGVCLIATTIAYLLGARDDVLLAIAGLSATAPLFGSGAVVNAVGFDALLAMAKTITATLIMPITLLIVLWVLGGAGAHLDLPLYFQRLLIYVILPMALAVIARRVIPQDLLGRYYPKLAQFNIIFLLMFPLGLMGGVRATFDDNPMYAMNLFILASVLAVFFYFFAYFCYKKHGSENAIICALVCGGRNVFLTYAIAMPFLGTMFLPLIGAFQLPAFCLPMIGRFMAKRHHQQK